jgi:hypothetical protein
LGVAGAVQILGAVWRLVVHYCCLHVPLLLLLDISQSMPMLLLVLLLLMILLETPHALQPCLRQVLYPLHQHLQLCCSSVAALPHLDRC